jgi:hypothetical protein
MAVGDKDHSRVTMPIAALPGGPGKRFDLRGLRAGRNSLLLGRVGIRRRARTDRFSLFGRTNCRCVVIGLFPRFSRELTGQGALNEQLISTGH